jgi:molybdopterin converting factor small subunit
MVEVTSAANIRPLVGKIEEAF